MLYFRLFICMLVFSTTAFGQENADVETTTYFFIRHAEKVQNKPSVKDMHLNEEGYQRVQSWKQILQHIQFDAIYTTNFNRTKETVLPIASENNLELTTYSVAESYNAQFKEATRGKTVLVVGHSNTIPDFVNAVIGQNKYKDIDETNNGNIYIVTIMKGHVSDVVLTIN